MASAWGENHPTYRGIKTKCVCGVRYDDFRTGMTFKSVRRLIISIHWCTKKDHVKYGRRNGTLGYWHELKWNLWESHVLSCESVLGAAA